MLREETILKISDFLSEGYELLLEHEFYKTGDNDSAYEHEANVHGHNVKIKFNKASRSGDNDYNADFYVNGNFAHKFSHENGVNTHHNHAILHHVNKVINSFIHHKKPSKLIMTADDMDHDKAFAKRDMYHKFATHLAHKHGGKAVANRDGGLYGSSEVHFK